MNVKNADIGKNNKKSAQSAEPNQIEKLRVFFQDIYTEFQKITWPTLPEVVGETQRVLVLVALLTALVWVFDLAVGKVIFEPLDHLAKQVSGHSTLK